jgi:hypothetical protein
MHAQAMIGNHIIQGTTFTKYTKPKADQRLITCIRLFFELQHSIKLQHWFTKSHARHVALDTLLDEMTSHIDQFVEVAIGKFNIEDKIRSEHAAMSLRVGLHGHEEFKDYLIQTSRNLESLRLPRKHRELENIIDDMLVSIQQALYRLRLS